MKRFKGWGQLQTVLTVAECGSYRAAAAKLGVTSSTVARHVEAISEELGQPVFLPSGNNWELTDVGKELVSITDSAQTRLSFMLKNMASSGDQFEALQINTLSFVNSDFLAPALHLWQENYSAAQLSIDASDQTTAVERGEADVALRLTRPETPGIARFKLADCKVALYTPEGGAADAWIGLPTEYNDLPEMKTAKAHFGKSPAIRLDSYRAMANAAVSTGLSCVLPSCMAREFPVLHPLMQNGTTIVIPRELWFLFYETRKNDPAIVAAKRWVKQIFPSPNKCLCGKCDLK